MKKNFYSFLVLVHFCCCSVANAQDHMWVIGSSDTLYHMTTDGEQKTAASTIWGGYNLTQEHIGYSPRYIMQTSSGDAYVVNSRGGNDDFGTIVRITPSGIQKIRDLGYAQDYQYLVEGADGYIYGVKTSAFNYYIFRFRPDGSDYKEMYITSYGFQISELTVGPTGEIFGTTQFFLYKFRPDMSGVDQFYEYEKETGKRPIGKLVNGGDGFLYGVTEIGGNLNYGVVYKIRPDGTDYTVLHMFDNANGRYPDRGLVEDSNGNLYGTTFSGGEFKEGVLFTIRKDGTGFSVLHHFDNPFGEHYTSDNPALQIDEDGRIIGTTPGYNDQRLFQYDIAAGTMSFLDPGVGNTQWFALFQPGPPAIEITDPNDGDENQPIYDTYMTTPIIGALYRTIEFSETPDFENVLVSKKYFSGNMPPVDLKYNTLYYARAKSSLWPGYGETISFTTRSPEAFGFVTNPADGAENVNAPDLKVTANYVRGATRYTIDLSTSPDFDENVMTMTSSQDHQRTMVFQGLAYDTRYYARMKTNISTYGRITSFTTRPAPMETVVAMQDEFVRVFPNPSQSSFVVEVDPRAGAVETVVMNAQGEVLSQQPLDANGTVTFGNELEKGIYILKIRRGEEVITRRLVKQ